MLSQYHTDYVANDMQDYFDELEEEIVEPFVEAPLKTRALAQALDLSIFVILFSALWLIPGLTGWQTPDFVSHFSTLVLGTVSSPISFWVSALFLTIGGLTFYFHFVLLPLRFGATIGMRMLGLRIVSLKADRILTADQLLTREVVGKWVLGILLGKGIALLLPLFREDRRGVPDLISNTVVKSLRQS